MIDGLKVIQMPDLKSPFSFLKTVFIPKGLEKAEDFDQVLTHESIHVQQGHTYDLIYVQLMASIFWFNPIIWRLLNHLKTIHEYIADEKVINKGYSLVGYQTMLLRQVISNNSHGLVHNFNLSFIRRRIAMMNHKKSGWTGRTKVLLTFSIAIILAVVVAQGNAWMNSKSTMEAAVQPYLDDERVDREKGVKMSTIESSEFKGIFTVQIEDIEAGTISYEATHVRGGIGLTKINAEGPIDLLALLRNTEVGDWIVVEVNAPDTNTIINFGIVE